MSPLPGEEKDNRRIDALLKAEEVAEILNISRSFAFQLMRRGEIPTVRLGKSVRVRPADLQQYIVENLHS